MTFSGDHIFCIYGNDTPLPQLAIKRLGFTGHRDREADPHQLFRLWTTYGNTVWVHGDAIGFDTQVREAADAFFLTQEKHPPKYADFPDNPKYAPIHRNRHEIVDTVDALVGLWDGRTEGGTYDTIRYANSLVKPIILLLPYRRTR